MICLSATRRLVFPASRDASLALVIADLAPGARPWAARGSRAGAALLIWHTDTIALVLPCANSRRFHGQGLQGVPTTLSISNTSNGGAKNLS
jgi:hypothetical protein